MLLQPLRVVLLLASGSVAAPLLAQGAKFEPPGDMVYHGASLPRVWESGLSTELANYSKVAGKKLSIVTWFASYYENGSPRPTSWKQNYLPNLYRVRDAGAMSLIKFSTQDNQYAATGQIARTSEIASGKYDSYFAEFADTIKLFGGPVFISFDHEMNGNWYPYSQGYTGARPVGATAQDYVAAWRRIVGIFKARGVGNAAWVWSPNVPDVDPASSAPASDYYPGDDVVDWVGASFYSGNVIANMKPFYQTYAARKPIFITEWATAPEKSRYYGSSYPGDAAWVRSFFKAIETSYPRVKAISWFEWKQADGDYLLQRVPEQAQSYSLSIQKPRYIAQAQPPAGTVTPSRPPLIPDGREIVLSEAPRAQRPPVQRPAPEPIRNERIHIER